MKNVVRVRDIDPEILEGPYTLRLARAVTDQYLENGSEYLAVHAAPRDLRDFFLVATIDETSADQSDHGKKLMVEGGTQYGCSAQTCPFCPFSRQLRYYRDLTVEEMMDLFRMALFLHGKIHPRHNDNRELSLKFTDNGEPLHSLLLPQALDRLLVLFGRKEKVLRIKISTILKDTQLTRETFREVLEWQTRNVHHASIHLQISRAPYGKNLIPAEEVAQMIERWVKANPEDKICIAPGLIRGYHHKEFLEFCKGLKEVAAYCFFRPSIIKSSLKGLERRILTAKEMEEVEKELEGMGFEVSPLPRDPFFLKKLEGAGTLSHLPNGKFYDPATYHVWKYTDHEADPNVPIK